MDLQKTLKEINQGREKIECAFVFCCWRNPELFDMYSHVNVNNDKTLQNEDAKFYWAMGRAMRKAGLNKFDMISVDTFLTGKDKAQKKFEKYGGYQSVSEIMSVVKEANVDSYYQTLAKMTSLETWATKTDELLSDVRKFDWLSNDDVYNAFEEINNSISINTSYDERIENLAIEDSFLEHLEEGQDVGFNYGRYCPLLNYITLGIAPGSLYMVGAHSGSGKTSMIFENMVMGLHYQEGVGKIGIISNEMKIETYRHFLLIHILTKDMKYYGLTRKQLKIGKFNEEQKEKLAEAIERSRTDYSDIEFVKLYDNSTPKIMKYITQMAHRGAGVVVYDTLKANTYTGNKSLWETLLSDSRKLFQLCSRLNIALVTSYQLALHTQNIRYLDATCLSNAKQVKEVYETITYLRPVWEDERDPESKYYIKPWRFKKDEKYQYAKDENGKRIKETIQLDPEEKYMIVFVDKTRSDEDKQTLLYRWRGRFNDWREEGFCTVTNMHIYN